MSTELDDIFGTDPDAPKVEGSALRRQLESVLAEKKEMAEKLAALEARDRQREVQSLFTKHAIPELAKDFFPKDAELTDEAATAFVEKYGQLWGATAAESTVTPEQQQAVTALQQFTANAGQPATGILTQEQAAAKYGEAKSKEDVMRMVSEATAGYQVLME